MPARKFSNQKPEQIIAHLSNLFNREVRYNLFVDPLCIHFTITESLERNNEISDKRKKIKEDQQSMTKGQRKLSGTRKRKGAKIRSVKKGRTVNLKGRV
jgi:hypothetical protein